MSGFEDFMIREASELKQENYRLTERIQEFSRAVMEETVLAGYPGGDRTQSLANVRAMRHALMESDKRDGEIKRLYKLRGNLLDHWDGLANDTKDQLREVDTGFYNAVEAFRTMAEIPNRDPS